MHSWLVNHNVISPQLSSTESARKALADRMSKYYYDTNSYVWDSWTDSQLRAWLIDNNVIKGDSKTLARNKMTKLVENSYTSATTTVLSTWSESQLRSWLVDNGYMSTSESGKLGGKGLFERVKDKFSSSKESTKSIAPYHHSFAAWPDPRLRAFLLEHGVKESQIPESRPTLLQKMGEVWSESPGTWSTPPNSYGRAKVESDLLLTKIQNIVNSGVEQAEDKVTKLWELLTGYYDSAEDKATKETAKGKEKAAKATREAMGGMGEL